MENEELLSEVRKALDELKQGIDNLGQKLDAGFDRLEAKIDGMVAEVKTKKRGLDQQHEDFHRYHSYDWGNSVGVQQTTKGPGWDEKGQ